MAAFSTNGSTVILLTRDGMGEADQALRHKLLGNYLRLLDENDLLPDAICFYTHGVKLVVDGSPVLEQLRSLERKGVRLLICSTCLKELGLADRVQVGIVGGMADIIEAQRRADKVITL